MTLYICLVLYMLVLPLLVQDRFPKRRERKRLILALIPIYLMLALKATTVGSDTAGYKRMYDSFFYASWSNYDLYWTEHGYETLEMIATHILNLNFAQFAAIIYAFICISYYKFWKKYSRDVGYSCFVYVCIGLICFDLSGLRNALALAIFLLAVPYAEERGFWNGVKFFAIMFIAAQIHNSAYVGFIYFVLIRYSLPKLVYLAAPFATLAGKRVFASLIKGISNKDIAGSSFGGNVIFYVLILVFILVLRYLWSRENFDSNSSKVTSGLGTYFKEIEMPMRVFYLAIMLLLFSGSGSFTRVANYGLFFSTILLPNACVPLNKRSHIMVKCVLSTLLIAYFYWFKLRLNELNMLPYLFFWQ